MACITYPDRDIKTGDIKGCFLKKGKQHHGKRFKRIQ